MTTDASNQYDELLRILDLVKEGGWDHAEITLGDLSLVVSNRPADDVASRPAPPAPPASTAAPAPAPVPAPAAAPSFPTVPSQVAAAGSEPTAPVAEGDVVVSASSLGTFWRSPQPDAPPFVEVGDVVEEGQTLCIIEVMKLMSQVKASAAGVVTSIGPANGDMVEFGTPLFTIRPQA